MNKEQVSFWDFVKSVKWFLLAWFILMILTLVVTGLSLRALLGAFFAWCGGLITGEVIALYRRSRGTR